MKRQMIIAIVAASTVCAGAAGGAAVHYQDTLLKPLRSEQVAPPEDGPAYQLVRNTLRSEPCRYWLGFSC